MSHTYTLEWMVRGKGGNGGGVINIEGKHVIIEGVE